jgi:hypothetical protein
MNKEQYVQYLRDQAKMLQWLANEIENGEAPGTTWLVDWRLHKELAYIDEELAYASEAVAQ